MTEVEAIHPAQDFTQEQAAYIAAVFQAFSAGSVIPLITTLDEEPCIVLVVQAAEADQFTPFAIVLNDGFLGDRLGVPEGTVRAEPEEAE